MIIDEQLPAYDVAIAEHVVVDADPRTTWEASRHLDFVTVRRPLLDAAMWVRGLPSRLHGRPMPLPNQLLLARSGDLPGWVVLGERAGEELAFGAVGKFWRGDIEWRAVALEEFAGFAEPGYGKIACNLSVRSYGSRHSLLTYECRASATDPATGRRFRRYLRVTRPFIARIMRAAVTAIAADASSRRQPAVPTC